MHDCIGFFFFFKQKTAYEMRISDWSSDVCSSDLDPGVVELRGAQFQFPGAEEPVLRDITFRAEPGKTTAIIGGTEIGRASCGKECVSTCRSRWSPYH